MSEYPEHPGFKVPGPSQEAAAVIQNTARTIRVEVLRTLILNVGGMTADEIAGHLQMSVLTVRPRVSELHRAGMIRKTDRRGKNQSGMSATVWTLADFKPGEFGPAWDRAWSPEVAS